tara:strand:+ start:5422 stop:6471 length:1050 start_codon:yes stop_codon:yes gene_type:complete
MKRVYKNIFFYIIPILLMFSWLGCEDDTVDLNTSELEVKIVEAIDFLVGKEEGDEPGYYSNQTITKLQNRIEWAQAILTDPAHQKELDNAILVVQSGMDDVTSSEIFEKYPKIIPGTTSIKSPANIAYAPLDEFTVECRFKPASLTSNSGFGTESYAHIFCTDHQYVGANTGGYALRYYTEATGDGGFLQFTIGIGNNAPWWSNVNAGYQFEDLNKWYHVAVTYNASNLVGKVYIDGVLAGEGTFLGPMVHDMENGGPVLGIGYSPAWDNDLWKRRSNVDGQIIDFRIWGEELSEADINARKDDFLSNVSQYPTLNAYWPLNAQKGNPMLDATGRYGLNAEGVEWIDPN